MKDSLVKLTDSLRQQVVGLKRQLDMLESGKMTTGDQLPSGLLDTTEETKTQVRSVIAELERLISDYDPRLR
jgi:hypothetical protein